MIDIITHCWSGVLDQYAYLLHYQLFSIAECKPQYTKVRVNVCTAEEDTLTRSVVEKMRDKVEIREHLFSVPDLMRRAIGRNEVAKDLSEDSVLTWYADCDYLFGDGCLDSLFSQYMIRSDRPAIIWPSYSMTNVSHQDGDDLIQQAREGIMQMPYSKEYYSKRYKSAIGGIQITPSRLARELGYMAEGSKFLRPVGDGNWKRTHEDPRWRKYMRPYGTSLRLELPNLYRIRHTQCGREVAKEQA